MHPKDLLSAITFFHKYLSTLENVPYLYQLFLALLLPKNQDWKASFQVYPCPFLLHPGFFVNVLFSSYRVWDESHKKYPEILRLIAEHNPEYLRPAMADHERKLKICKVEVYSI